MADADRARSLEMAMPAAIGGCGDGWPGLDSIASSADTREMAYPGGKNGSGVFQTIINLMPPHPVYIEPFLGGGAILRLKRPAALNIGLDLDSAVIARMRDATGGIVRNGDAVPIVKNVGAGSHRQKRRAGPAPHVKNGDTGDRAKFRFLNEDAFQFLRTYKFTGDELVYCDPPYVHSTRTRCDLYQFEMSDAQHVELLRIIRSLPCRVMISGYWTKLYAERLAGWNSTTFQAVTRSGRVATEWLWFNFPEPVALHDYRYLGTNFRERERIKRKKLRWANRLSTMPVLERRALMAALDIASPNAPMLQGEWPNY
jgi:DNA adenine methylase